MNRRKFNANALTITAGSLILPTAIVKPREVILVDLKSEAWLLSALKTFAKYAGLDELAENVWDYLFDEDTPQVTQNTIKEYNTMMVNGGFSDFSNSTVYMSPGADKTVMYAAQKQEGPMDVCVGVTSQNSCDRKKLMLDGPAIFMLSTAAQLSNNTGGNRDKLLPGGNVYQGSTGSLLTGYKHPIVYDTPSGNRVGMSYAIEENLSGKVGKGEIAVVEKSTRKSLVSKMFEFPLT